MESLYQSFKIALDNMDSEKGLAYPSCCKPTKEISMMDNDEEASLLNQKNARDNSGRGGERDCSMLKDVQLDMQSPPMRSDHMARRHYLSTFSPRRDFHLHRNPLLREDLHKKRSNSNDYAGVIPVPTSIVPASSTHPQRKRSYTSSTQRLAFKRQKCEETMYVACESAELPHVIQILQTVTDKDVKVAIQGLHWLNNVVSWQGNTDVSLNKLFWQSLTYRYQVLNAVIQVLSQLGCKDETVAKLGCELIGLASYMEFVDRPYKIKAQLLSSESYIMDDVASILIKTARSAIRKGWDSNICESAFDALQQMVLRNKFSSDLLMEHRLEDFIDLISDIRDRRSALRQSDDLHGLSWLHLLAFRILTTLLKRYPEVGRARACKEVSELLTEMRDDYSATSAVSKQMKKVISLLSSIPATTSSRVCESFA
jgi:hypothetical protein